MKPLLVIGLGNPLMGDEGIGTHVAERLTADPRLPAHAEVICGGTDLLRCAGKMEGRSRVVLLDAIDDGSDTGNLTVFDRDFRALAEHQENAHHLSVIQSVGLLSLIVPTSFTLLGISISTARCEPVLSPCMTARMPEILRQVLDHLS